MGASTSVIQRALYRICISSLGESAGRFVNILLPVVVLASIPFGSATDVFFMALAVAFFVQGTLGNVLASVLVSQFVSNLVPQSAKIFVFWATLLGAGTGVITFTMAVGVLGGIDAVISALSVMLISAAGILAAPSIAALNAGHRYGLPGITWSLRLFPLAGFALSSPDMFSLSWLLGGIAMADISRTILLWFSVKDRITFSEHDQQLAFPMDALFLLASSAVAGLTPLASRWLAGFVGAGGLSIFEAADRIFSAFGSLATIGFGNVVLVYLARLSDQGGEVRRWPLIVRLSAGMGVLCAVAAVLLGLFMEEVAVIFHMSMDGNFIEVQNSYFVLCIGLPALVMGMLFSRRIVVARSGARLLSIAVSGFIASACVGGLLVGQLGVMGVAIGVVIGQYLTWMMMAITVRDMECNESIDPR